MKRISIATTKIPVPGDPVEDLAAFNKRVDRYYATHGSSLLVPFNETVPVGKWFGLKLFGDNSFHELYEVVRVPVKLLEIGEDTGPAKWPDVERYADWLLAGHTPPPITVFQLECGRLKSCNHRRLLAAKLAGQEDVLAMVSWMVTHSDGGVRRLCLNNFSHEAKRLEIWAPRLDYTIFPDDQRFLERAAARRANGAAQPTFTEEQPCVSL